MFYHTALCCDISSSVDYRGKELLSELKARYVDLKPELDDLEQLLKHKDLEEMSEKLRADSFVRTFAEKK